MILLLLASTLTVMAGAVIAASPEQMSRVFDETPDARFLSKLVLTLPALFVAIASPLAGFVLDAFGRLRVLVLGLVLYAVAGSSGLYLDELWQILIGRAVLGVAVAGVMSAATSLIGDYFTGPARSRVVGWQGMAMALGGVFYVTAGGWLADLHWRAPFAVYGISLLLVPPCLLFLNEPEFLSGKGRRFRLWPEGLHVDIRYVLIGATGLIGMAFFYMVPVQISFLLPELGVMERKYAGLAIVPGTLGGAFAAANYGRIRTRMRFGEVYAIMFCFMAAGYGIIAYASGFWQVFLGMGVAGLGLGLLMPNSTLWVMDLTPEDARGRLIGLLSAMIFLGQFLSPFLTEPLMQGGPIADGFGVAALILLGGGVLFVGFSFWRRMRRIDNGDAAN